MNDINNTSGADSPAKPIKVKVKVKKRLISAKKRIILVRISAVAVPLLFAVLFASVIMLNSRVASLNRRLAESEEYIAAANSRIYQYAAPGDLLHFTDKTYGDLWLEALDEVPLHEYDFENLELGPDNRYTYYVNGEQTSKTGIDVSYHQGDIDWNEVYLDGIDFVMVRVGYRGYESGLLKEDEKAREYIEGALAAGLDVGAYFYSQAVTEEEAREEAKFACGLLKDYKIKYPVVFDWELPGDSSARTNDISAEVLNKCAAAFCSEVDGAGYIPMIYSNLTMALCKFDMRGLYIYDFWYVEYKDGHNPPLYPYEFHMWQYASDGRVKGIDTDVDMNICFTDYERLYNASHAEE